MSSQDQDFNNGAGPSHLITGLQVQDSAFFTLKSSLSIQVLKINANVQGIFKLVNLLGTAKDSPSLRENLDTLTEATRVMVVRSSEDLKKLIDLQSQPHEIHALREISHRLLLSLRGLLLAQRACLGSQTEAAQGANPAVEDGPSLYEEYDHLSQISLPSQESTYDLSPQESQEIETEIREAAAIVYELAEIFGDVSSLFATQDQMINDIEVDFGLVSSSPLRESTQVHIGRVVVRLVLLFAFVVAVVLLAVLS